ncbi:MAG: protein kinase [bacterium]|nr:protein kinase [bacterium]
MAEKGGAGLCPECDSPEPGPDPNGLRLPPRTVVGGRYLLGKVLGQGGFGITYLGWDLKLNRKLAVKEYFPREFATRATGGRPTVVPFTDEGHDHFNFGLKKFLAEGQALVKFQEHPGIVSGFDYLEANDTAYLVMEYVDGKTLDAFLQQRPGGRLPAGAAVAIMMHVMDALQELHRQDVIHRDVSPDNIYITRANQVKLLDFGSARDALRKHSQSMDVVVKHGYSPVEQYQKRGNIGPWTDVYAVAATLYRVLVGEAPPESIERVRDDRIVMPRNLGIVLPDAAEQALLRALAVHPPDRLRSIRELQEPLIEVSDGTDVTAEAESAPTPDSQTPPPDYEPTERVESHHPKYEPTESVATGRVVTPPTSAPSPPVFVSPPRPRRTLVAVAALVVLVLLAVGAWYFTRGPEEPPLKGTLVLRLEPPAYATLDGHRTPEGGQRLAPVHRFPDLEARTYRLKVWRDGYEETRKQVNISAGNTEELRVELDAM